MRAVSLSNPKVIALLNRYTVPVYLSNEDFRDGGAAPATEKAELQRIRREAGAAGLSVGTVHAFILDPAGRPLDSLHVADAFKPDPLIAALERNIAKLKTPPGAPGGGTAPQEGPPAEPGALTLHLTARYLERRGNGYALVTNAGGNWSAFPAEDWVTLTRKEGAGLFPPGEIREGAAWEIDPAVAGTLLRHFYPHTENSDLSKNRIERQSMRGTVLSVRNGIARARIKGGLKMVHSFYGKEDGRYVEADLLGYMEIDLARKAVRSFRLLTGDAVYRDANGGGQPFGIAVRSVPPGGK